MQLKKKVETEVKPVVPIVTVEEVKDEPKNPETVKEPHQERTEKPHEHVGVDHRSKDIKKDKKKKHKDKKEKRPLF